MFDNITIKVKGYDTGLRRMVWINKKENFDIHTILKIMTPTD
jgi:hypothetical protein